MKEEINLIPSELKAIEEHKWYLSEQQGKEVSFEEALRDFLDNYEADWMREKQCLDCKEQADQILQYKWLRSEQEGYDIGKDTASKEWISKYAHIWREEKESLEANGFTKMHIKTGKEKQIKTIVLSDIAHNYDCEIYINKDRMKFHNFIIAGRKNLNIKSILCPVLLDFSKDEEVRFLATGSRVEEALASIREIIV
ncbi:MAG: HPr family phosphocarrier protein [Proteobacteria bacterium]|nr:HPr family phosphocarrier protein [Pseudomonadota bacterium]